MTHEEHLQIVRSHHLAAVAHHADMADCHGELARCHTGKVAELHRRLRDLHKAHAEHHARLEKLYADSDIPTHESSGPVELERLHKLLS